MEFCDEVSLSSIEMGLLGWYLCLDRRGRQLAVLLSLSGTLACISLPSVSNRGSST